MQLALVKELRRVGNLLGKVLKRRPPKRDRDSDQEEVEEEYDDLIMDELEDLEDET